MCFSATASFSLGSALIITRVIQQRVNPINYSDNRFFFSLIPLVFGIQQLTEGFIWLAIDYSFWDKWKIPALYSFTVIAQVIWPLVVPFSFLSLEQNNYRRRILKGLTVIGAITSTFLFFYLIFFPIEVRVHAHHLIYELRFGNNPLLNSGVYYFVPTVLPAFFSSRPNAYLFALLVLFSFVVSKSLFPTAFISIWCYFAAVISVSVYWILKRKTG